MWLNCMLSVPSCIFQFGSSIAKENKVAELPLGPRADSARNWWLRHATPLPSPQKPLRKSLTQRLVSAYEPAMKPFQQISKFRKSMYLRTLMCLSARRPNHEFGKCTMASFIWSRRAFGLWLGTYLVEYKFSHLLRKVKHLSTLYKHQTYLYPPLGFPLCVSLSIF